MFDATIENTEIVCRPPVTFISAFLVTGILECGGGAALPGQLVFFSVIVKLV